MVNICMQTSVFFFMVFSCLFVAGTADECNCVVGLLMSRQSTWEHVPTPAG